MDDQLIGKIKQQFSSEKRISEMLVSYNRAPSSTEITRDPYEPLREEHIFKLVLQTSAGAPSSLLDLGCGIGNFVLRCLESKIDATGLDVSEKMVEIARKGLLNVGHETERVVLNDIFQFDPGRLFDFITAIGVIWYYPDKLSFLRKVFDLLKPGGRAYILHRNALFNLYALNRGTLDLFTQEFFQCFSSEQIDELDRNLTKSIAGLAEPKITHTSSALEKTYENPLTIAEMYSNVGLEVEATSYVYIHPTPPRLHLTHSDEVTRQVQEKFCRSWQGMFLGSQFVVHARKPL